jgi:hypothetical protein
MGYGRFKQKNSPPFQPRAAGCSEGLQTRPPLLSGPCRSSLASVGRRKLYNTRSIILSSRTYALRLAGGGGCHGRACPGLTRPSTRLGATNDQKQATRPDGFVLQVVAKVMAVSTSLRRATWIAGSSPAMTVSRCQPRANAIGAGRQQSSHKRLQENQRARTCPRRVRRNPRTTSSSTARSGRGAIFGSAWVYARVGTRRGGCLAGALLDFLCVIGIGLPQTMCAGLRRRLHAAISRDKAGQNQLAWLDCLEL